ncbi:MAG: MFS transporter [Lachnospiraceae bacterium]|nr:MFS transporter [Lachnospiraceae bacterium]
MNTEKKTRLFLFIGSAATLAVVVAFLVILNIREPEEYTRVPLSVLFIVSAIACLALGAFFARGPVFDEDGNIESVNINAMLLVVLVIIQVSFFFEIISVRNQRLNYELYMNIRHYTTLAEKVEPEDLNVVLTDMRSGAITDIAITAEGGKILYSSDRHLIGERLSPTSYTYPFTGDTSICYMVDGSYNSTQMRSVILNLITVLVTSVFFSVEIVIMMTRVIARRMTGSVGMTTSLYYIRQISFLFYFASRLSSAFIPIMAKSLPNPFGGMSGNTAAGLPQSAETLLTCSAIFITTLILEKKGWKLPFVSGVLMVAAGTFLSAFSVNLPMFILSRAIVGLGYGFCWMTMRNLSLFGKDQKEQLVGFALLNAGIYAGMNCGSSLGAILADIFGYKTVFVISGVATLVTTLFIMKMENAKLSQRAEEEAKEQDTAPDEEGSSRMNIISAVLFVILMIAPASIAASFTSYFLPVYFEDMGKTVTDVGRAQLLYGIVIVYAGPLLSKGIAVFKERALKRINLIYNLLISLSLFLPGIGSGMLSSFIGSALLGTADSFGFGVQNNYFLALPAVRRLGASRSLSVLSFIKKLLEMAGPLVFAAILVLGYQAGIRALAISFAVMALAFVLLDKVTRKKGEKVS